MVVGEHCACKIFVWHCEVTVMKNFKLFLMENSFNCEVFCVEIMGTRLDGYYPTNGLQFYVAGTNPKSYLWIFVLIRNQEEKCFYHVKIMRYSRLKLNGNGISLSEMTLLISFPSGFNFKREHLIILTW